MNSTSSTSRVGSSECMRAITNVGIPLSALEGSYSSLHRLDCNSLYLYVKKHSHPRDVHTLLHGYLLPSPLPQACCNEHAKPPYTSECASQNTTCPASALAAACSKIPHCSGFNSNGWLKSCVTAACGQHIEDNPSVNTYIGSSTAPGPWPPTPPQPSPSPSPPPPSPYTPPPPPPSKPPAPPSRPLSPPSPVPNVDDFHFPHEEAAEMAAAARLTVVKIHAVNNHTGELEFIEGGGRGGSDSSDGSSSNAVVVLDSLGQQSPGGWVLRSFIVGGAGTLAVAVIEKDWARWGAIMYLSIDQGSSSSSSSSIDGSSSGSTAQLTSNHLRRNWQMLLKPAHTVVDSAACLLAEEQPKPVRCTFVRKGVGQVSEVRRPR